MSERIAVSMRGAVADVKLNRAEKLNALDQAMIEALVDTGRALSRDRSLRSVAEMFLFKLAFLLLAALSLRYVEAAAERADWKAFLVAFVAVAALVHTTAVVDNVRLLKAGAAERRAPAGLMSHIQYQGGDKPLLIKTAIYRIAL